MMTLYEIVKQLQSTGSTNGKLSILAAHKDNEQFKRYMQAVYDVGINYYQKKVPKEAKTETGCRIGFGDEQYLILSRLADRKDTGQMAKNALAYIHSISDDEAQELLRYVLDRSIGAGVGDTLVLKTWPSLYFLPYYQRCSLLDKKARERFGKLKRFYVQTKADGSFAYVVKRLDGTVDVITRQGSKYPQWFAQVLAEKLAPGDVLVGELLVDEKQDVEGWGEAAYHLDRKTANGLLNSALKDGEKFDLSKYTVRMEAWDYLTQEEFEAGKSKLPYEQRLTELDALVKDIGGNISVIFTASVTSLEEAFAIYQEHLQRGLEGVIISDPDDLWKDGTSKGKVKLKIKFVVEMRVISIFEGQGKAAGMVGGVMIASEDKGIICDCGSGFTDAQRKYYWDSPDELIHKVIMVEANDITQSRDGRKKPALSLPIFCEVRYDKLVADTTERIYAQLEAAKQGA